MKLSEDKQARLYAAIADPIMDHRVLVKMQPMPNSEQLDERYFILQSVIWQQVHKALNLEGPA